MDTMNHVNDRTEHLIVRKLDGEITPAERSELNRELLRNPAARKMFDDYRRIDGWTAAVVSGTDFDAPHRASGKNRGHVALAAAAAVILALLMLTGLRSGIERDGVPTVRASNDAPVPRGSATRPALPAGPLSRELRRNLIVVPAENGNTYLVPVDTIRRRTPAAALTASRTLPDPI